MKPVQDISSLDQMLMGLARCIFGRFLDEVPVGGARAE